MLKVEGIPLRLRFSRSRLKNGCRTLPLANFAPIFDLRQQRWLNPDGLVSEILGIGLGLPDQRRQTLAQTRRRRCCRSHGRPYRRKPRLALETADINSVPLAAVEREAHDGQRLARGDRINGAAIVMGGGDRCWCRPGDCFVDRQSVRASRRGARPSLGFILWRSDRAGAVNAWVGLAGVRRRYLVAEGDDVEVRHRLRKSLSLRKRRFATSAPARAVQPV
jgi:hypothetical protein